MSVLATWVAIKLLVIWLVIVGLTDAPWWLYMIAGILYGHGMGNIYRGIKELKL